MRRRNFIQTLFTLPLLKNLKPTEKPVTNVIENNEIIGQQKFDLARLSTSQPIALSGYVDTDVYIAGETPVRYVRSSYRGKIEAPRELVFNPPARYQSRYMMAQMRQANLNPNRLPD